jgi:hypothetical protein
MHFQSKNLKFEMVLYFIDVHQYYSPQKKNSAKISPTTLVLKYICIIKKLCDQYYFVINICIILYNQVFQFLLDFLKGIN